MKKPRLQQRGERRIAAALRIALAAALLAVQVLFVVLTTRYLKDHFALIYGALEGIALITALYIYNKPGDLSYRVAWIIPILFVPVVGLILYLLWGGDTQRKRLQRQTAPKLPPEEPESLRNRSALNADRLQRALPGWSRVSQYLSSRGFYLYQNTKAVYLPEGALLLEDILGRIKAAERFIFMEYFILAEGKLWDRMSAALCERARSGVEVKIIFDDFGNIKRFSAESLQTLRTTKRFALSDILTELVKKLQDVVFPPKADAYLYKELAELEWLCWCEMTRRYRLTAGTQEDIQLAALVSVFIKLRGMIAWRVCCRCVV